MQAMHDRMTELEAENTRLRDSVRPDHRAGPCKPAPAAALAAQHADLEQHMHTSLNSATPPSLRSAHLSSRLSTTSTGSRAERRLTDAPIT